MSLNHDRTTDRPSRIPSLPPVTVLMPVYNGARYVGDAIDSILRQTHEHFELLIIDDGSTDSTPAILDRYAARDARIRVLHQANIDQPATLNRGLELATYDWVAIMDHDDVCLPGRLERELELLQREPEARLIGTWAVEINAAGRELRLRRHGPTSVAEFRKWDAEGRRVPLVHPSVLMHRPTILQLGGYDPDFSSAADSELWTRVARFHPIVVVPEPLILYRIHRASMSFERMFEQRERLRWIEARDEARRRGDAPPSVESLRADRRGRLRSLWRDIGWLLSSYHSLAIGEGRRIAALGWALGAGLLAPKKIVRRIQRSFSHDPRGAG